MRVDDSFLKVVHEQQREMIEILELFEDVVLNADYRNKGRSGYQEINRMFRQVKDLIDRHLAFESEYLLPLLRRQNNSLVSQRLLQQRNLILSLIAKMIDAKLNNKKEVVVWGTGKASREFLYVEDAAEAILLATEKYNKSEPANLGSGKEIKIYELKCNRSSDKMVC